ncbi:TetR/AcrR family transcriptional regulator [Nonomuraea deserti]|uniref:TetR/AcrR family transcriptional regulator n=1 Tax=Nonomuraea deserti TaxID=1848322 RepID=A0A4R4VQL5_9ACTN|nr:TetR/AcrR family transcriptional regulator [Nonomuraea deserti]
MELRDRLPSVGVSTTTGRPRRAGRPRKEDAKDTRAVLLEAALDLFVEKGYAATSVRMIARAAGLSDAGLYGHFAGKRAIYDELLASAGPGAVGQVIAELFPDPGATPDDPEAFLRGCVARVVEFFEEPAARKFSRLLLREEIADNPGVVNEMISQGTRTLGPIFSRWAERGLLSPRVRARLLAGELDGGELAWELLSPLVFIRLTYLHGPDDLHDEGRRRAASHLELFLDAAVRR